MAHACFPNVSQYPIWETLFSVSVTGIVSKVQIMRMLHGRGFNENPSTRALAKILRVRASKQSSNFCEQFEQRPNFASTFKLDGTIQPLSGTFACMLTLRKPLVFTGKTLKKYVKYSLFFFFSKLERGSTTRN